MLSILLVAAALTSIADAGCIEITTIPPSIECPKGHIAPAQEPLYGCVDVTGATMAYVDCGQNNLFKKKPQAPARWSALATYDDGKVVTHEGMKSAQLCQEVLCSLRYSKTCGEHEDAERAAAKRAEEEARAYHLSVAVWRKTHPCEMYKDRLECSSPDGGGVTYFKDKKTGKYSSGNFSFGVVSTSTWITPVTRYITHAVCYQEVVPGRVGQCMKGNGLWGKCE